MSNLFRVKLVCDSSIESLEQKINEFMESDRTVKYVKSVILRTHRDGNYYAQINFIIKDSADLESESTGQHKIFSEAVADRNKRKEQVHGS